MLQKYCWMLKVQLCITYFVLRWEFPGGDSFHIVNMENPVVTQVRNLLGGVVVAFDHFPENHLVRMATFTYRCAQFLHLVKSEEKRAFETHAEQVPEVKAAVGFH